jgi:hypothetical protein
VVELEVLDVDPLGAERLGDPGEDEAIRAATLLESQGYSVVVSAVIDA